MSEENKDRSLNLKPSNKDAQEILRRIMGLISTPSEKKD